MESTPGKMKDFITSIEEKSMNLKRERKWICILYHLCVICIDPVCKHCVGK